MVMIIITVWVNFQDIRRGIVVLIIEVADTDKY